MNDFCHAKNYFEELLCEVSRRSDINLKLEVVRQNTFHSWKVYYLS